jgi:hypothetical protein
MSTSEIEISQGPDKADLLRAVTNPDKHLHVTFHTPVDPVEAHIDTVEEIGTDGFTFGLRGHLASGNLRGAAFTAIYDSSNRRGRLVLKQT